MKQRCKIYVTRQIPQKAFDVLIDECNVSFWNSSEHVPRGELLNNVSGVDALLCMPTDKVDDVVLNKAGPSLKVVGTLSESCSHIDIKECERRNIKVVTMTTSSSETVVDLTISVLQKEILRGYQDIENANKTVNKNDYFKNSMKDKTLGLIGLGATGVAIGKQLREKGISKIQYNDFTIKPEETEIDASYVDFDKILEESDIICICCKGTTQNRDLFYKDAFNKMKKSIILIDAARGHVINYHDLYEALREHQISVAAVDLREQGKIPYRDQLMGLNNCIFVPYQESNRWDKRNKTSSTVADQIVGVLKTECVLSSNSASG